MKEVSLADLPTWSAWPARLLGLTKWNQTARNLAKVEQEYNQGKYAQLLARYEKEPKKLGPDELEDLNYNLPADQPTCISRGDQLYEVPLAEARAQYYALLSDYLRPWLSKCPTVVELGSGYGYNLWRLHKQLPFSFFWGGDYSANAVRLGSLLYQKLPQFKLYRFNYYDADTYQFLAEAAGPVVIFTSHSLEQIPCAQAVFDALTNYRQSITQVIHFEPAYQLYDNSLLGQMRSRYTQLNNYNVDLLDQLHGRKDIRVDEVVPNVLGLNVLNPTSVIAWSFV